MELSLISTTTPSPVASSHEYGDNPQIVHYNISIPYTDPLWIICESEAEQPLEPPLSSCDCLDTNRTLPNNDTVLACNCSFALMEKCSKLEYSFQLPDVVVGSADKEEVKATAECACKLNILETRVENEDHHHGNMSNSTDIDSNNSANASHHQGSNINFPPYN